MNITSLNIAASIIGPIPAAADGAVAAPAGLAAAPQSSPANDPQDPFKVKGAQSLNDRQLAMAFDLVDLAETIEEADASGDMLKSAFASVAYAKTQRAMGELSNQVAEANRADAALAAEALKSDQLRDVKDMIDDVDEAGETAADENGDEDSEVSATAKDAADAKEALEALSA